MQPRGAGRGEARRKAEEDLGLMALAQHPGGDSTEPGALCTVSRRTEEHSAAGMRQAAQGAYPSAEAGDTGHGYRTSPGEGEEEERRRRDEDVDLMILTRRLQLLRSQRELAALHCEKFVKFLEKASGAMVAGKGQGQGQGQGQEGGGSASRAGSTRGGSTREAGAHPSPHPGGRNRSATAHHQRQASVPDVAFAARSPPKAEKGLVRAPPRHRRQASCPGDPTAPDPSRRGDRLSPRLRLTASSESWECLAQPGPAALSQGEDNRDASATTAQITVAGEGGTRSGGGESRLATDELFRKLPMSSSMGRHHRHRRSCSLAEAQDWQSPLVAGQLPDETRKLPPRQLRDDPFADVAQGCELQEARDSRKAAGRGRHRRRRSLPELEVLSGGGTIFGEKDTWPQQQPAGTPSGSPMGACHLEQGGGSVLRPSQRTPSQGTPGTPSSGESRWHRSSSSGGGDRPPPSPQLTPARRSPTSLSKVASLEDLVATSSTGSPAVHPGWRPGHSPRQASLPPLSPAIPPQLPAILSLQEQVFAVQQLRPAAARLGQPGFRPKRQSDAPRASCSDHRAGLGTTRVRRPPPWPLALDLDRSEESPCSPPLGSSTPSPELQTQVSAPDPASPDSRLEGVAPADAEQPGLASARHEGRRLFQGDPQALVSVHAASPCHPFQQSTRGHGDFHAPLRNPSTVAQASPRGCNDGEPKTGQGGSESLELPRSTTAPPCNIQGQDGLRAHLGLLHVPQHSNLSDSEEVLTSPSTPPMPRTTSTPVWGIAVAHRRDSGGRRRQGPAERGPSLEDRCPALPGMVHNATGAPQALPGGSRELSLPSLQEECNNAVATVGLLPAGSSLAIQDLPLLPGGASAHWAGKGLLPGCSPSVPDRNTVLMPPSATAAAAAQGKSVKGPQAAALSLILENQVSRSSQPGCSADSLQKVTEEEAPKVFPSSQCSPEGSPTGGYSTSPGSWQKPPLHTSQQQLSCPGNSSGTPPVASGIRAHNRHNSNRPRPKAQPEPVHGGYARHDGNPTSDTFRWQQPPQWRGTEGSGSFPPESQRSPPSPAGIHSGFGHDSPVPRAQGSLRSNSARSFSSSSQLSACLSGTGSLGMGSLDSFPSGSSFMPSPRSTGGTPTRSFLERDGVGDPDVLGDSPGSAASYIEEVKGSRATRGWVEGTMFAQT